jgi:hypothetical protein
MRNSKPHGMGTFTFADTGEKLTGMFYCCTPFGLSYIITGVFIDGKPPNDANRQIDQVKDLPQEGHRPVTAPAIDPSKTTSKLTKPPNQVKQSKVHTPFLGQYTADSLF